MEGLAKYLDAVERTDPIKYIGRVTKVLGLLVESRGPHAVIGEVCQILLPRLGKAAYAEVVGLREDAVQLDQARFQERQVVVEHVREAVRADAGRRVPVPGEAGAVAVDDALLQAVFDAGRSHLGDGGLGRLVLEQGDIGL